MPEKAQLFITKVLDKDGNIVYWKDENNRHDFESKGYRLITEVKDGYRCPYCLNGWRRDVGEDSHDEECITCNATGVVFAI